MRRSLRLAALLTLIAPVLAAQAPRITAAGDPSVQNDTIYSLAVNPADYKDQTYVFLLDDGVERFEADGRSVRTYRQVIQVLTPEAAERWGELTFSYSGDREKLTVNWARVLKPTGEVISAKPVHEQESLAPVAMEAPVYSDEKVHRLSLGGVAAGTLVDYSYTIETLKPVLPGDFTTSWSVMTGRPTRRSRLLVDVPAALTPRIIERHLAFARQEKTAGGRHVYIWATKDVPKPDVEPLAPDSVFGESITVAAPIAWGDIATWYAGLAKDRYALTPEIEARLADVVKNAHTLDDSLRAVHRWVAQDFRYVSLSLGIGGYQPHPPAQVFQNKYGDCKDKATLFIALAKRMGVTAYPVLLNASGGVDTSVASVGAFDHMIAAVQRPSGWLFLDLTADIVPYGEIPPNEQGEFGLIVHPDGTSEPVRFPQSAASANREEAHLVGTLASDGMFTGTWSREAWGTLQYGLRSSMARTTQPDSTEKARATLALANAIIEGSSGDSLTLFDGRDLTAAPRISVHISKGHVSTPSGNTDILTLPIRDFASPNVVSSLEARGARKYPIDAEKVWGTHEELVDLRITLPPGWTAKLPPNVTATSAFGSYSAQYAQTGRELRVTRQLSGTAGVQPASAMPQLLEWLKALNADDVKFIVIAH